MSYSQLLALAERDYSERSVLLLGGGRMGFEYCRALHAMHVRDVLVVTQNGDAAAKIADAFGYEVRRGGYQRVGGSHAYDLAIVATPIITLQNAADHCAAIGCRNVLVEKPGALFSASLADWAATIATSQTRVRIAYNRVLYPSLWRFLDHVRDGCRITSCRYSFAELSRDRPEGEYWPQEIHSRWGVANSLHVISMAHAAIGAPATLSARRAGRLEWHETGAQFVGEGQTDAGVPFTYHADWESAGRWSIEVFTTRGAFLFQPIEELSYRCNGSDAWQPIPVTQPFAGIKPGVAEQLAVMLLPELEATFPLVTIDRAAELNRIAEAIFGYPAAA